MNRKSVKFPFVVRTVAVMIAIWLMVCLAATFVTAGQHLEAIEKEMTTMVDYLEQDLKECTRSQKDSVEYRDGLNVAEANAVLRYYRFEKLDAFRKQDAKIDIGLYRVDANTDGSVNEYYEAVPESDILMTAPANPNGKIIVFDDVFTKDQVAQIEEVIRKVDDVYVSRAIGYVKGRFFSPTELMIGDFEHNVLIKTDYRDGSRNLRSLTFDDVQVRLSDGTIKGAHEEEHESDIHRSLQSESEADGIYVNSGSYQDSGLEGYVLSTARGLAKENYVVKVYMKGNHFSYAMKQLTEFYMLAAFLILMLGCALVSGNNRSIEKRMETEFKRRGMMDSMAHEMKTPLSIIRNYGEVLKEEHDETKRQQFTQNIIDEADGLNRAIVSMLDLSKMEAGTYPMELSSLSVSKLAEKEVERTAILAQQKKLDVQLEVTDDERILADEKLVKNIISNFLSNAIKHTPEGGRITLAVDCDGNSAHFSARNQGESIADDEIEKIWDSYYGIKSSGKESSGIGLAIVRNACMMHSGSYGCYNETDGVTFWAKINSMENRIAKAEVTTGPVIGVTQGNLLNGILLIAAGLLMQAFFVPWNPVMFVAHVMAIFDGEALWFTMLDYSETVALCISIVQIFAGVCDLYKKKLFTKKLVAQVIELLGCSVAMMFYGFFYKPTDPLMSVAPDIIDMALVAVEVVMLVLMILFGTSVFLQLSRIAMSSGRARMAKALKAAMVISMLAFVIWFVLAWRYIVDFGCSVILAVVAGLWIYTAYKIKGKIVE